MKIVAFTGAAGAGKDTAAEALIGWQRAAMATPLKEFCQKLFNLDRASLWGPSERRSDIIQGIGRTVRHVLQTLGTEWGRDMIHPDVWVNHLLGSLRLDGCYTVTDIRYENEARKIREAGGVVIEIVLPPDAELDDEEYWRKHSSEAGLPDSCIDAVIVNDGTIDDLHAEVRETVHRLFQDQKPAT